jgi:hypothetical protein
MASSLVVILLMLTHFFNKYVLNEYCNHQSSRQWEHIIEWDISSPGHIFAAKITVKTDKSQINKGSNESYKQK